MNGCGANRKYVHIKSFLSWRNRIPEKCLHNLKTLRLDRFKFNLMRWWVCYMGNYLSQKFISFRTVLKATSSNNSNTSYMIQFEIRASIILKGVRVKL